MKLYEIEKSGYKCFDHIEEARNKTAQVNAIKYIKQMASLSQTDIADWDLLSLFKNGDREEVVTNKNKINQVFFAYREIKPGVKTDFPEALTSQLLELQKHKRSGSWQSAAQNRDHQLTQALTRRRQMMEYLASAKTYSQQVDALQGKTSNLVEDVKSILAHGFWTNLVINGEYISFETINNVIVTYVDEKHGVMRKVDFGKFKVNYNVKHGDISASLVKDNFNIQGGYPHPHIAGASICYGHTPESDQAFAAGDLTQIFDITQKVLLSYNPGSPYVTLEKFEFADRIGNRTIRDIDGHPQWQDIQRGKLKMADVKPMSEAERVASEKRAKQMQKYNDTGNWEYHPDFDHYDDDNEPCDTEGERINDNF